MSARSPLPPEPETEPERERSAPSPRLHNSGVPALSRLRLDRLPLPGPRFVLANGIDWWGPSRHSRSTLGSTETLARDGAPAAIELLERRRFRGTQEEARRYLDALLAAELERIGLPDRIGVFVAASEGEQRAAGRLERAATLAVLSRRSGPLYLPRRPFEPSLVRFEALTLVFPKAGRGTVR